MLPSESDMTKIRDYVMYPYMLEMIRHQVDMKRHDKDLMSKLAVMSGEALHDLIYADFAALKREFRERKIRIWQGTHDDMVIRHHYVIDGYNETFSIIREVLKAEISVQLGRYVKILGEKMRVR